MQLGDGAPYSQEYVDEPGMGRGGMENYTVDYGIQQDTPGSSERRWNSDGGRQGNGWSREDSRYSNWSWGESSWRTWPSGWGNSGHYENWSWDGQSESSDYWDSWESNPRRRTPAGSAAGAWGASPISPRPGYDRHGNLPSGEVSSVGEQPLAKGPGGDAEDGKTEPSKGKVSTSYPPIFRAKPNESYQDWRRAVAFWLGGEGHSLPKRLVGPRLMVQLRDRAGQLAKHLNLEDVNGEDGMEKIFKVLEASPLVKQLDKHRIDQHRKRLMSLTRLAGESLESYKD